MKKQIISLLLIGIIAIVIIGMLPSCQKDEAPTVETHPVEELTASSVLAGGIITDQGSGPVLSKGVCWTRDSFEPTLNDDECISYHGSDTSFKVLVEDLLHNTTYYLRAFATNQVGTAYGNMVSFKTICGLATIETLEVTEITYQSALGGGIIHDEGVGPILAKGLCWSTDSLFANSDSHYLVSQDESNAFEVLMEDLIPKTDYYVRAYAVNEADTAFGQTVSFTTLRAKPKVETNQVEEITYNSAVVGGTIIYPGGEPITSQGVCFSQTNTNPGFNDNCLEDHSGDESFSLLLEDLSSNTDYYVRAYASNSIGDDFGQTVSFTTNYETVSDIDGNEYRILEIGEQTWMIDNLRATRFSNGDPIPLREENHYWTKETAISEPAYCWYNNDESYKDPYGALYNFEAAADPRNVCPTGWRVMDNEDRRELIMGYLGTGHNGGDLKTTGTIEQGTGLWYAPNTGATNDSGFSDIPAGFRNVGMGDMGYRFTAWTSTSIGTPIALGLAHDEKWASTYHFQPHYGFSIRCIKE